MRKKRTAAARIEAFSASQRPDPTEVALGSSDTVPSSVSSSASSARREIEEAFVEYRRKIVEIRVRNGQIVRRSLNVATNLN